MLASVDIRVEIPVYPERLYRAWLDSAEQKRITGQEALVEAWVGGLFSGLGGRVSGVFLSLIPHSLIRQTWRVADLNLPESSNVELYLTPTCTGCELRIKHHGVPVFLTRDVITWWEKEYLHPLQSYFESLVGDYIADMSDG